MHASLFISSPSTSRILDPVTWFLFPQISPDFVLRTRLSPVCIAAIPVPFRQPANAS